MRTMTNMMFAQIIKYYNHMFDDFIAEHSISLTEIHTLLFFANNPEFYRAKDLVEVRGLTKSQASIAIASLIREGYLTKSVDPHNRRSYIIKLTDQAAPVVKELQEIQNAYYSKAYQGLSHDDVNQMNHTLTIMYQNLDGVIKEGSDA